MRLSLRDMATATGFDHSWLAKVEKGQANFNIDSLIRLMIASGISGYDLVEN